MKLQYLIILILTFFACGDSEENDFNHCTNSCVLIDKNLYNTTSNENYTITNVHLNGDLLTINISSGGLMAVDGLQIW